MAVAIASPKTKRTVSEGKESQLGKGLSVAGGVVGGILGAVGGKSPQAAIAGYSAGSSLGGTVGNVFDPAKAGSVKDEQVAQQIEIGNDSAMARKLAASREDRLAVLRQAEAALPQLPPELRQEYAGTIVRATMEEEKRRAMGMGA